MISASVFKEAPECEMVKVPAPSPSSALISIRPAIPWPLLPVGMKLTMSEASASSSIPVSAFSSISPPSDVMLLLTVIEPRVEVSVILEPSPVVCMGPETITLSGVVSAFETAIASVALMPLTPSTSSSISRSVAPPSCC